MSSSSGSEKEILGEKYLKETWKNNWEQAYESTENVKPAYVYKKGYTNKGSGYS